MFDATTYEIILKEMLKDGNYSTGRQMFSIESLVTSKNLFTYILV